MWVCSACTFENDGKSFQCGVCALPRHATTGNATIWWQCPKCCQLNKERMARCAFCFRKKPEEVQNGAAVTDTNEKTEPERDGTADHDKEIQEEQQEEAHKNGHITPDVHSDRAQDMEVQGQAEQKKGESHPQTTEQTNYTGKELAEEGSDRNDTTGQVLSNEGSRVKVRESESSWSCGKLYKTAVQAVTPYLPQFTTPQPEVADTSPAVPDTTAGISHQPLKTCRPSSGGQCPEFSVDDLKLGPSTDAEGKISEQWNGQDPFYLDWSTVAIGDDLSGSDTDLMARSTDNASPSFTDSDPDQPDVKTVDEGQPDLKTVGEGQPDLKTVDEGQNGVARVEEVVETGRQNADGDPNDAQAVEEDVEFPDQECRLVLVGKTGNGKSSLGNTLLGLQRFQSCADFSSTTTKCQRHNTVRFGVHLEVVDTPGLFDTEIDRESIIREIAKCFGMVAPGLHAIVLVLRIGVKFTREENEAVEEVYKLFGLHLLRFLVIVFTHGDRLQNCGDGGKEDALKAMLDSAPEKLRELINHANHRYVVFDNTADEAAKSRQVRQLLITVKNLLAVNGGRPFSSTTLRDVELCMQNRETELKSLYEGTERRRDVAEERTVDRLHYRDIAREELAQERPLLDVVKSQVLPVLVPILHDVFKTFVVTSVKYGRCSLQ